MHDGQLLITLGDHNPKTLVDFCDCLIVKGVYDPS
jgi:hypothetical protein